MATFFKKFSKPLPKHTHCHIICHVHRNKREVSNYGMKDTWCWLLPSLLTFPVLLQSPSWSMSGNLLQRDHHGQYLQYSCIGQLCLLTFRDITDFELNLASFLKVSLSVFPDKKKEQKCIKDHRILRSSGTCHPKNLLHVLVNITSTVCYHSQNVGRLNAHCWGCDAQDCFVLAQMSFIS